MTTKDQTILPMNINDTPVRIHAPFLRTSTLRALLCIECIVLSCCSAYAFYNYCWYVTPSVHDLCAQSNTCYRDDYTDMNNVSVEPPPQPSGYYFHSIHWLGESDCSI